MSESKRDVLDAQLSRRQLLKVGVGVPLSAAFLAACGSWWSDHRPLGGTRTAAPSAAPSAAPVGRAIGRSQRRRVGCPVGAPRRAPHRRLASAPAENFSGQNIVVTSRGAGFDDTGMFKKAKADWEARTGGTVEFQVFTAFGDFDVKYAGYLASQDSSVDLLYTYEAFTQTYGERLYEDLSAQDTSDFVPGTVTTARTLDGVFRALPAQAELVIFAFNADQFEKAGIDPDAVPDTWAGLYAFSDALKGQTKFGHASSILSPGHCLPWFLTYYNSTPSPLLSDDRTQLMFDNQDHKDSLQTLMDGIDAGFYDMDAMYLATSYDHTKIWYNGDAASTTTFTELIITGLDPAQSQIVDFVRRGEDAGRQVGRDGHLQRLRGVRASTSTPPRRRPRSRSPMRWPGSRRRSRSPWARTSRRCRRAGCRCSRIPTSRRTTRSPTSCSSRRRATPTAGARRTSRT